MGLKRNRGGLGLELPKSTGQHHIQIHTRYAREARRNCSLTSRIPTKKQKKCTQQRHARSYSPCPYFDPFLPSNSHPKSNHASGHICMSQVRPFSSPPTRAPQIARPKLLQNENPATIRSLQPPSLLVPAGMQAHEYPSRSYSLYFSFLLCLGKNAA